MHIIPVQTPPTAFAPDETNCIEPGIATLFENPSKVRRLSVAKSFCTKTPIPSVKSFHPPIHCIVIIPRIIIPTASKTA